MENTNFYLQHCMHKSIYYLSITIYYIEELKIHIHTHVLDSIEGFGFIY